MTITALNVPTLKAVKNAVIGNRTAKGNYGRDEVFVSRLVECINDPPTSPGDWEGSKTSLRIEAAHILASLSYGSLDALRTLLRLNASQALLYAVSTFQPTDSVSLKAAITRALRAIATAIADAVGPSQWGLSPSVSDIRPEAKAALDYVFQPEIMDVYIPLLNDRSPQVSTAIAQLIASSVRDSTHRTKVSDWCPPGERTVETKGKRGWEKRDPTKSPSRQGGWITRTLAALLRQKDAKLQEAALSALASVTKENEPLASRLARAPPGQESVMSTVLSLCKSRNTDLQLAASLCATNILRAPPAPKSHIPYISPAEQTTAITIMHVLNRIISSDTASNQHKTKACFILYYLVTDHKLFCQLAYERNCLVQVAQLVTSITPIEKTSEDDEDEPESVSRLREAALTAVAAIAMFDNDIRTAVTDELKIIPAVQVSLTHQYVGVRYAACQCARALSRAVSALRTNIVDTGLGMSVFQLFMKQDEDRQVMHAASTVVCNVVTDFSPLRSTLIEQGVITRLVQLLNTGDSALRLNALWAFKNLLYKATPELKRQVMNRIGWQEVRSLLEDPDHRIREQAFHIIRHVADGVDGVDLLFSEMGGSEVLLGHLAKAIESEDDEDVVLQAVFVLANMANSAAHQRSILADQRILRCLRDCLIDAKVEIRRPAISCVLELVRQNPRSHRELHEAKIDSTLRHMCEHSSHVSASPTALRLTGGRQMGAEDDLEVQGKAQQALHWLEHNADMDV
ncbi:ARM repeat-containing protein [Polyporus arcularius HHB13444]|uniref:ARM repeat-containing protein n=1 Tax=Polyporus arcularius HHB13444 TaxID=1314778 RepID=A0A5C3Q378_9APHY|nr:ARM repeat-containing protein [Polyporus arcularius HHB13444]